MIFSSKARAAWLTALAGLAVAAAAAGLSACGGGTSQYEAFLPKRLFAFGDENSTLSTTGQKYGVNSVDATTGVQDCTLQPLWVQIVASSYGFTFAECNPNSVFEPQAHMFASAGSKVADVAAQVEAQVAAGGFRDADLALILVGANDVLELYGRYPERPESSLLEDARQRGLQLAHVVNRLVALGAKVVVSNVPDMGVSPFALAEKAANLDDVDRAAVISHITAAFNEQLGASVLLDGRYVGLMQTDLQTQVAQRSPGSVGLTDASTPVCTAVLPNCTTQTLVTGADPRMYLWADATRLATGGQALMGSLALSRTRGNPF